MDLDTGPYREEEVIEYLHSNTWFNCLIYVDCGSLRMSRCTSLSTGAAIRTKRGSSIALYDSSMFGVTSVCLDGEHDPITMLGCHVYWYASKSYIYLEQSYRPPDLELALSFSMCLFCTCMWLANADSAVPVRTTMRAARGAARVHVFVVTARTKVSRLQALTSSTTCEPISSNATSFSTASTTSEPFSTRCCRFLHEASETKRTSGRALRSSCGVQSAM